MLKKVEGSAVAFVMCSLQMMTLRLSRFNVVLNAFQLLILIISILWRSSTADLRKNETKISALTHATCYRMIFHLSRFNVALNTLQLLILIIPTSIGEVKLLFSRLPVVCNRMKWLSVLIVHLAATLEGKQVTFHS